MSPSAGPAARKGVGPWGMVVAEDEAGRGGGRVTCKQQRAPWAHRGTALSPTLAWGGWWAVLRY